MKKLLTVPSFLLLTLISCGKQENSSETKESVTNIEESSNLIEESVVKKNTVSVKDTIAVEENESNNIESDFKDNPFPSPSKSIFVDVLSKFYESQGFYLELYYLENFTNESANTLAENHGDNIYEGEEMYRTNVPIEVAKRFLEIESLDSMYVLNEDQEIVDSITLQNIEYLDAMLESSYIASYNHPKEFSGKLVMSKSSHLKKFNKSPEFKEASEELIEKLIVDPISVGEVFKLYHNKDTFHIFSYTDKEYKHHIHLVKNGSIKDTIEEYYLNKMQPVPLASEDKIYYIVHGSVPDTDHSWTQLLGMDLKTSEFVKLRGNRMNYK